MLAVDLLITEHRLIERGIAVLTKQRDRLNAGGALDTELMEIVVDFTRTYADRTHHGKEEEILFRDLGKKPLSAQLRRTTDDLVLEHAHIRNRVTQLVAAKELYLKGSREALRKVIEVLNELLVYYAAHIEKEEKHFFQPAMEYFTDDEKARMSAEMTEYDSRIIHEKYTRIIEALEQRGLSDCGQPRPPHR